MTLPVLAVDDLHVSFRGRQAELEVVHGVSFDLRSGERLGVVGESGSGKSVTALAAMRLLGRDGRISAGSVRLAGRDLASLDPGALRKLRGREIAMVFQDPMTSLNPAIAVGRQIVDVLLSHERIGSGAARTRAAELLTSVGIPDAAGRLSLYPHELSGGMRQRVLIALALACRPKVLIADEPTTALDVTVQAQIVALLRELCERLGVALLFISHNLDLVAELCDRIAVMYRGRIVEMGPVEAVFARPRHPYTRLLLASVPRIGDAVAGTAVPLAEPVEGAAAGGCAFAPRCPHAFGSCDTVPPLVAEGERLCACWLER